MGCCTSISTKTKNPLVPTLAAETKDHPPTAWLTSSGFGWPEVDQRLVAEFLKVLLKRKGVFDPADESSSAPELKKKYAETLATIKVMHYNGGNWVSGVAGAYNVELAFKA